MLKKLVHAFLHVVVYVSTLMFAHVVTQHVGQIAALVRDELVVEFGDKFSVGVFAVK